MTTSASGSAPDAARSLRLTAAARKPRSRHDEPVEAEVDALDERVLGDDEPAGELRRVVLDARDQAAALELGQQAELTELREPHRPPAEARDPSPRG